MKIGFKGLGLKVGHLRFSGSGFRKRPKTLELGVDLENSVNDSSEAHYAFPEPDATVIPSHHFNALHQAGKPEFYKNWVAVKELELSYYIGETLLFTIYTHYVTSFKFLNSNPEKELGSRQPLHEGRTETHSSKGEAKMVVLAATTFMGCC